MTLSEHFTALDSLLKRTRRYWQCVAFEHDELPWPELADSLFALNDTELPVLDADPKALVTRFIDQIPELAELPELTELTLLATEQEDYPFWLSNGIKGRKFEQLKAFVDGVFDKELPVLEWCAGKGHLGRMLAFCGVPRVDSVELQSHLCEQGELSARKQGLNMHFHNADVLSDPIDKYFRTEQHAVALHACGGLHQAFMKQAVAKGTVKLSLSPCCYHLFGQGESYRPMSEVAGASSLTLAMSDLKLALQETVTAPGRTTRIRQKEVEWRLGFDCLRRNVTGTLGYVSVPSSGKAIFSGEFSEFCRWAAEQKGILLPDNIDFAAFLQQGKRRKRVTDRIELIRHLFRRAIEVWLVLDRALYLEQHGYRVAISAFCEKQLTPRNILISAKLASQDT